MKTVIIIIVILVFAGIYGRNFYAMALTQKFAQKLQSINTKWNTENKPAKRQFKPQKSTPEFNKFKVHAVDDDEAHDGRLMVLSGSKHRNLLIAFAIILAPAFLLALLWHRTMQPETLLSTAVVFVIVGLLCSILTTRYFSAYKYKVIFYEDYWETRYEDVIKQYFYTDIRHIRMYAQNMESANPLAALRLGNAYIGRRPICCEIFLQNGQKCSLNSCNYDNMPAKIMYWAENLFTTC